VRSTRQFLVDQEGTASSLRGVRHVAAEHGLFCSLYIDRGSQYFFTPEGGAEPVSAARWSNSASSTSRHTPYRHAADRSERSRRCRTACREN
jgi:hypothetical protein